MTKYAYEVQHYYSGWYTYSFRSTKAKAIGEAKRSIHPKDVVHSNSRVLKIALDSRSLGTVIWTSHKDGK